MTRRMSKFTFCNEEPSHPVKSEQILLVDEQGRTTYRISPEVADTPPASPDFGARVDNAIRVGRKLLGIPYGNGWQAGTWPKGAPLYSDWFALEKWRRDIETVRASNQIICTGMGNVIRALVANLPAFGRAQSDGWPGGTAAIGRTLARMKGSRPYVVGMDVPRGWGLYSPYQGPALNLQGHWAFMGDGDTVIEGRVPDSSNDRTPLEVHRQLINLSGTGWTHIIPPELWLGV